MRYLMVVLAAAVLAIAVVVGLVVLARTFADLTPIVAVPVPTRVEILETHEETAPQTAETWEEWHSQSPNWTFTQADITAIDDTGYLILLNRENSLSVEIDISEMQQAWPTVPVSFIDDIFLHPTAIAAIRQMLDAAQADGLSGLHITSGFRTYAQQAALYENTVNRAFVLPPAHSEHHTGLAADIMAVGVPQSELAQSPHGRWMAENSWRFGLILRYPQGSQAITGVAFEPWHFRYVGRVHAQYMRQNGLLLEEYLARLQNLGNFDNLEISLDGTTFYIFYEIPRNGVINLPEGLQMAISSDNMGGFIVKAW
ncbi:MAG: M15 family metallopeptidase [Defluviitaleaceae bacterium]|nr:M15 family metallopeptidase [Defluviitaleaceae bacterium]